MPRRLLLLVLLAFPLHALVTPGVERTATVPARDTAAFAQFDPKLATDGQNFYAVWLDASETGRSSRIFGCLLSDRGQRLQDPVVLGSATRIVPPHVFWTGSEYVVMWETGSGLNGRRVDARGESSADELIFADFPRPPIEPALVAFNGTTFLAVVRDAADQYDGIVVNYNNDADHRPFFVTSGVFRTMTDIAVIGETFYLIGAYVDINGTANGNGYPAAVKAIPITAYRFPATPGGQAGPPIDIAPATTPVFDLQTSPAVDGFTVAWSTASHVAGGQIRSAHVTRTSVGAIESFAAEGQRLHEVVGETLLYGAPEQTQFYRRGTASGTVSVPCDRSLVRAAATNGATTLLLVEAQGRIGYEYGPAGADLYTGTFGEQTYEPLMLASRHQTHPDIAAADDLRLAAWSEYIGRDRRLGVVATRIGATGQPIDGDGIDLAADTYHPTAPRVASNGTDWLVTWVDLGNVYVSRVSHSGRVLDALPLLIGSGVYDNSTLAAAWDGRSYVVVYLRGGFFKGPKVRAIAVRVSSAGEVMEEIALTEIGAMQSIAIAGGGEGSLIVWDDGGAFNGVLLSRTNTMTPVALQSQHRCAVAWDGSQFLVAGVVGSALQWQRVSASGVVSTPVSRFPSITALNPSIEVEATDGGFLLVWSASAEILTAFVNDEGLLEDGPSFVATSVPTYDRNFGVAGNAVVYSRTIADAVPDIARVFVRAIEHKPTLPRRRAVR